MKTAGCDRARRELLRGVDRVSGPTARHLDDCGACARFAERFQAAHDGLREHRAAVVPDAGFAARVTAALPAPAAAPADALERTLSWAALRLLPAAVALALVLGAWCWIGTSSPASLAGTAPSDDVLTWVLENGS